MSIRFMLDSDDLNALTDHADILATYSDLTSDPAAIEQRYPASVVVWIDRGLGDPNSKATVMDIETGALTVADAPHLFDQWLSEGRKYITGYLNRANLAAFNTAMGTRQVWRWVATLDGTAFIAGDEPLFAPAAIQCLSSAMLGMHADGSLVLNDDWHPQLTPSTGLTMVRDLNSAVSACAALGSDLHKMVTLIGG